MDPTTTDPTPHSRPDFYTPHVLGGGALFDTSQCQRWSLGHRIFIHPATDLNKSLGGYFFRLYSSLKAHDTAIVVKELSKELFFRFKSTTCWL